MLDTLMAVRGMKYVLLIDHAGSVVASAGLEPALLKRELGVVAAGKAVIGSLQSSLGTTEWTELLIDVESGPVLMTPFGPQILMTAFDDVTSLGRVRFAVRRLLAP